MLTTLVHSTTILIPSYGIKKPGNTAEVRIYGLAYDFQDKIENPFKWFGNLVAFDSHKSEAVSDSEKSNFTANTDPFRHWQLKEDKEIDINIPNNDVIKTSTDGGGKIDAVRTVKLSGNVSSITYKEDKHDDVKGTIYLPEPKGVTIMTDVDDILRKVEIWDPNSLIVHSFIKTTEFIDGAKDLFKNWSQTLPNATFIYSTEAPIVMAPSYMDFVKYNFPPGPIDMRPVNGENPAPSLSARRDNFERAFKAFPDRKFILIGDTSINTVVGPSADMAREFPDQVLCIFIRNITASYFDENNPFLDLTNTMKGVAKEKWFVYDDLSNIKDLDVLRGQCHPLGKEDQQTWSGGYKGTGGASQLQIFGLLLVGLHFIQ
eukprot:NODE_682_length_4785_cov_0.471831.p2 type:complete len:374 gc:universal NODE_682_length_4785_cov_0.471831:3415-2294(-)